MVTIGVVVVRRKRRQGTASGQEVSKTTAVEAPEAKQPSKKQRSGGLFGVCD